jgi:hypothetical protein
VDVIFYLKKKRVYHDNKIDLQKMAKLKSINIFFLNVKSIYLKNLLKRIASHKNITNKINQLRKHRKQNTKG